MQHLLSKLIILLCITIAISSKNFYTGIMVYSAATKNLVNWVWPLLFSNVILLWKKIMKLKLHRECQSTMPIFSRSIWKKIIPDRKKFIQAPFVSNIVYEEDVWQIYIQIFEEYVWQISGMKEVCDKYIYKYLRNMCDKYRVWGRCVNVWRKCYSSVMKCLPSNMSIFFGAFNLIFMNTWYRCYTRELSCHFYVYIQIIKCICPKSHSYLFLCEMYLLWPEYKGRCVNESLT